MSNNLGSAISFLFGPAIVPDPPTRHRLRQNSNCSAGSIYANDCTDNTCPIVSENEIVLIQSRLDVLMYLEAGMVVFVFIMTHQVDVLQHHLTQLLSLKIVVNMKLA